MEQPELIEKIKRLPHDRRAEVEAIIDSLSRQPGLDQNALHEALSDYANHLFLAQDPSNRAGVQSL